MYTSYIGKKFLSLYRERNGLPEDYSARQFFDEEFFPVFFNDAKHLMHVHGSTFFQKVGKDLLKTGNPEPIIRLERLHRDIANKVISGSTYVGYAAGNITQPTSGQVTSLETNIDSEEMYASWIGEGLGIGIKGGILLIDKKEVLWTIFEGWNQYRKFLSQTPHLKDRQIETWNGHWLCHAFGKNFDKENIWGGFAVNLNSKDDKEKKKSIMNIPLKEWIEVVFALSRKYPLHILTANAYALSKMNTTYGFINIYLPQVSNLLRLQERLFTLSDDGKSDEDFEKLYSTFYNFKNACKFGVIGLKAIEPDKLRQFMPIGSVPYASGKPLPMKKEKDFYQFQIFKTWIMAMLNNKKELNALAEKVAQTLIAFEQKKESSKKGRGKSTHGRLSEQVKDSKNMKSFIDNLTEVMTKYQDAGENFKAVKDAVLDVPPDLFSLFIALIRFEYQYQKSSKS